MFKVRIDVPGYEYFNGSLGVVPFENGVSARPVTEKEAARLGAALRIVREDTSEQLGASVTMVSSRRLSAEIETPIIPVEKIKRNKEVDIKYSRDTLEEIASEGGIKAIRDIAKEFDVKGVEISKIIDDVMAKQLGLGE